MFKDLETRLWGSLLSAFPQIHGILFKKKTVIKFIVAGGFATAVDIIGLSIGKEVFHLPLRPAVAISFLIAFCVSFTLQKFWAFEDISTESAHSQAVFYFVISVANFFLNLELMTFLVEVVKIWYVLSKIIVSGGIAFSSFFIYRTFIFKKHNIS
jgi:putative flippase GtrA